MKKKEPDYSCWKEHDKQLPYDEFLKLIKPYRHIRIGVNSGLKYPFRLLFFRVTKKEVVESVRSNRANVTFSVMVNPNDTTDIGTMFIDQIRMTLLDKKPKNK